jgi:hypothetical protein
VRFLTALGVGKHVLPLRSLKYLAEHLFLATVSPPERTSWSFYSGLAFEINISRKSQYSEDVLACEQSTTILLKLQCMYAVLHASMIVHVAACARGKEWLDVQGKVTGAESCRRLTISLLSRMAFNFFALSISARYASRSCFALPISLMNIASFTFFWYAA